VQGPDFPTGGIIYNKKDILSTYVTGRGPIVIRAKTEIVEEKAGSFRIIVSEIPYQVNKATLLEKIADLVRDKKIDGIRDIRDESNKDGVRVVIELKKDAYPKKVLNRLFQMTQLQETFHVNMLSLVDGLQPRVLQYPGQHRCRGGLAMRARHGNHPAAAQHIFGEPLRAGNERQPAVEDGFHQRVATGDHVADHPDVRRQCNLTGVVTLHEPDTGRRQLVAHRRIDVGITSGDAMATGQRELRQATHEGAADTEDVDMHGDPERTG